MKQPKPQDLVQLIEDALDTVGEEIKDYRMDGLPNAARSLVPTYEAWSYLLEGVGPDVKPRIVRMLETETELYNEV